MTGLIKRLLREENGQGMAEYGLILALIAVVVIAALTTLGTNIKTKLETVGNKIGENPNP
ncbi:flp pilus assembly protein, pilin Flp, pilin Flp [Pelotomaculum thermopropionicum SI]|uniref:Flp pilus assembly protein, pilin Flp, pilin Flp n=1 Tax=Pelotomaculum thermopropionicum (strain DSM 13744 / JCM 10971 / SI) TaxID=370438 RepID=A5D2B1_PELTS|nr:flp pilus assembly protein, pilin Flp, pilin Flp [Pelotomaculum thermopropionicum SI]